MREMREIKFRVWREDLKRYHYYDKYNMAGYHEDWANDILHGGIFEQYTGLKDKNGVEIYEGDIIRNYQTGEHPNHPGTVDFNYGCWGYDCYHASHLPLDQIASESEIIGNIHEPKA